MDSKPNILLFGVCRGSHEPRCLLHQVHFLMKLKETIIMFCKHHQNVLKLHHNPKIATNFINSSSRDPIKRIMVPKLLQIFPSHQKKKKMFNVIDQLQLERKYIHTVIPISILCIIIFVGTQRFKSLLIPRYTVLYSAYLFM